MIVCGSSSAKVVLDNISREIATNMWGLYQSFELLVVMCGTHGGGEMYQDLSPRGDYRFHLILPSLYR